MLQEYVQLTPKSKHEDNMANKGTPHKHAELIKKWADGYQIQFLSCALTWEDCETPTWNLDRAYRVKPAVPTCTLAYINIEFAYNQEKSHAAGLVAVANAAVADYFNKYQKDKPCL